MPNQYRSNYFMFLTDGYTFIRLDGVTKPNQSCLHLDHSEIMPFYYVDCTLEVLVHHQALWSMLDLSF